MERRSKRKSERASTSRPGGAAARGLRERGSVNGNIPSPPKKERRVGYVKIPNLTLTEDEWDAVKGRLDPSQRARVEKELQEKNVPLLASSEGRKLLHFDGEAGAPPAALDFAGAGAAGGDAAPAATGGV